MLCVCCASMLGSQANVCMDGCAQLLFVVGRVSSSVWPPALTCPPPPMIWRCRPNGPTASSIATKSCNARHLLAWLARSTPFRYCMCACAGAAQPPLPGGCPASPRVSSRCCCGPVSVACVAAAARQAGVRMARHGLGTATSPAPDHLVCRYLGSQHCAPLHITV
jgi:hypothetical protein